MANPQYRQGMQCPASRTIGFARQDEGDHRSAAALLSAGQASHSRTSAAQPYVTRNHRDQACMRSTAHAIVGFALPGSGGALHHFGGFARSHARSSAISFSNEPTIGDAQRIRVSLEGVSMFTHNWPEYEYWLIHDRRRRRNHVISHLASQ